MKKFSFLRILLFSIIFLCAYSYCYVDRDAGGLFDKISNSMVHSKPKVIFERRGDKSEDSLVFSIQGMEQFTKLVVKNSYSKLVVLKLYSPVHPDSPEETSVFQAVADEFKSQAIFVGLNVAQNMDIVKQIAMFCRLEKIDLPLFLFYKDGKLIMPFLAGFQPKNSLSCYIQNRFFASEEQ